MRLDIGNESFLLIRFVRFCLRIEFLSHKSRTDPVRAQKMRFFVVWEVCWWSSGGLVVVWWSSLCGLRRFCRFIHFEFLFCRRVHAVRAQSYKWVWSCVSSCFLMFVKRISTSFVRFLLLFHRMTRVTLSHPVHKDRTCWYSNPHFFDAFDLCRWRYPHKHYVIVWAVRIWLEG